MNFVSKESNKIDFAEYFSSEEKNFVVSTLRSYQIKPTTTYATKLCAFCVRLILSHVSFETISLCTFCETADINVLCTFKT